MVEYESGGNSKMKMTIIFKDGYQLTLNGVYSTTSGEVYIYFQFRNEEIYDGNIGIELEKIECVRFGEWKNKSGEKPEKK